MQCGSNVQCGSLPFFPADPYPSRERIGKRWLLPMCTRAIFNHLACTYTGTPRYTSMGDITPTQLNGCQQAFKRCFNVETASSFNVKISFTIKVEWINVEIRRWFNVYFWRCSTLRLRTGVRLMANSPSLTICLHVCILINSKPKLVYRSIFVCTDLIN